MSDFLAVRGAPRTQPQERRHRAPPRDRLSCSPACARASRRSRSTPSTPRASAATSNRCRATPASSSGRWTSPTSTSSRASRRRSRSTRSRPRATRARRSARSPRSTTTCGCCTRASACRTARTAARLITRQTPQQIVDRVLAAPRRHALPGARAGRARPQGRVPARSLDELAGEGYTRARVDGELDRSSRPS